MSTQNFGFVRSTQIFFTTMGMFIANQGKLLKWVCFATKQDLEILEKKIEMTFKAEIEKTKSSTIVWLCSFIVAWTGVLSAIFFHFSK